MPAKTTVISPEGKSRIILASRLAEFEAKGYTEADEPAPEFVTPLLEEVVEPSDEVTETEKED